MIQLIVFLGNYGKEYDATRHNAAWEFEKSLPFSSRLSYQNKFSGELAVCDYEEIVSLLCDKGILKRHGDGSLPVPEDCPKKLYFLKPLTYMNLSGQSIIQVCNFYKIKPEEVLVVHDEIELSSGFVGYKFGGGLGGHNGLRSTKEVFGTADFFRLRFGIGKPVHGSVADFVLGKFTEDEKIILSQEFEIVSRDLLSKVLVSRDPKSFTGLWNKKKLVEV